MRLELRDRDAPIAGLWARAGTLTLGTFTEKAFWLTLVFGLVVLTLAYQSPRSMFVDAGGALEGVHMPGFYAPEKSDQSGATYRWSSGQSAIEFRGLGKPASPARIELQLSSGRAKGSAPVSVQVTANGRPVPALSVTSDSALYTVFVDPSFINPSGDLRLEFSAPTFQAGSDRRDLAFSIDFARVVMPAGLTLPSLSQLFWLLVSTVLVYWLLRFAWLAPWGAAAGTGLFLLGCAGLLAFQRLLLTNFTTRLAFTLLAALLFTLAAETVVRWLVRLAGWRGESALPEWAWTGLRAVFAVSIALKLGGVMYPDALIIDAPFHLKQITFMSEGRSWRQFFGETLAASVMPADEWGPAKAFIPYSPFFYLWASPLPILPLPTSMTVPASNAIFEALRSGLVFLIALPLVAGRRERAGNINRTAQMTLAAAAVYAFIPATFLLQQWGNWPTLASLWLLTLWAAIATLFWHRLTHPLVWAAATVALTLTMLAYTVTVFYTGLFMVIMIVAGWLFAPGERKRWASIALQLAAASALSLAIYYAQWIPTIIERTLPTFGKAVETQGKLTTLRPTWDEFITDHLARAVQSYNLAIIYALGLAGLLWLVFSGGRALVSRQAAKASANTSPARIRPGQALGIVAQPVARQGMRVSLPTGASWQQIWLGAWMATFPLLTLSDFWVDQALKEFWYPLPAISIVAGMWLVALLTRGARASAALAWLLAGSLAWQSVSLWVFRLLFHNR